MDAPESLRMMSSFEMRLCLMRTVGISLLRRDAIRSVGLWYLLWKRTSIACSKHIPRMQKIDEEIQWGTDDVRAKGGDYFRAKASPRP